MVCLMDEALIRFTFIISKLLFTIVVAVPLLCSGLPRLLGFAKRNRSRFFREKSVKKCSNSYFFIIYWRHFHTLLVTRGDEEDDLVIYPSIESD